MESSTHEVASIRTSFIYLQLLAQDDHGSDFIDYALNVQCPVSLMTLGASSVGWQP